MIKESILDLPPIEYFKHLIKFYEQAPKYTREQVYEASLEYFDNDDAAAKVFCDKYALQNNEEEYLELTPDDMHKRIATEFYRIERKKFKKPLSYETIYNLLKDFKYIIPQGSPMFGIGNPFPYITLSNCFVIESPVDSYGGILKSDEELVQISKRRGGVGMSLDNLRPEGFATHNAAKTTTGVLSFAERFSNSTREVGQNGRRGALMLSLAVHHPNAPQFIKAKTELEKITGANISVKLYDEFLSAVENNINYNLRFPVDSSNIIDTVEAKSVWDQIVYHAWDKAEPGILFWDNILRESPADCYAKFGFLTIGTNPCSELPLSADDSCRLLLQNIYSYVVNPFTPESYFDFELYGKHAEIAQRLMDNLVDLEIEMIDRILNKIRKDPESKEIKQRELALWNKIQKACKQGRRTGTGVTAVGDAVAAVGMGYGSPESLDLVEGIYKALKLHAYRSSVNMAKELGPFPIWDSKLEAENPFLLRIKDEDLKLWQDMQKWGRRNISLLTTAPAGTVSIEAQTSGGIEPEFSVAPYTRRIKGNPGDKNFRTDFTDQNGDNWMEFQVVKPKLRTWMDITGETDYKKSPWYGNCANDINWKTRVELQGRAQKHVDHAISSTVNLPNDATVEEVGEIYLAAWKHGCKGITVYREGSRTGVLVRSDQEKVETIKKNNAPKRPKILEGDVYHTTYQGTPYFVIMGMLDNEPYEVFAGHNGFIHKNVKKAQIQKVKRGHYRAILDNEEVVDSISTHITDAEAAICRLISLSLRHGADIKHCVMAMNKVPGDMNSFGKVVSRILKKYIPDGTEISGNQCLSCELGTLIYSEGCSKCLSCGWSGCS